MYPRWRWRSIACAGSGPRPWRRARWCCCSSPGPTAARGCQLATGPRPPRRSSPSAAVWVRVHGRPAFLVPQTVVAALLAAAGATVLAFLTPAGSHQATLAALPALVCLGTAVVAAGRLPADAATVVWGIAALGAPLAVVPLAGGLWQWPVALLAAGEVILLGIAARRRVSPILASLDLGAGPAGGGLAGGGPAGQATPRRRSGSARRLRRPGRDAGGKPGPAGRQPLAGGARILHPAVHPHLPVAGRRGRRDRGGISVRCVAAGARCDVVGAGRGRCPGGRDWRCDSRPGCPGWSSGGVLVFGYVCLRLRTPWSGRWRRPTAGGRSAPRCWPRWPNGACARPTPRRSLAPFPCRLPTPDFHRMTSRCRWRPASARWAGWRPPWPLPR